MISFKKTSTGQLISLFSYIWIHPSNHGKRVRALWRAVCWQVYKRLTGGFWDVPLVGNRIIRCYPDNTSASSVIYAHLFDYDEMRFLLRYLRSEDNFLDVGANVGVYTVLVSSIVACGEIHAFEPSSEALLRLKENIQINSLTNVLIHAVAVSDSSGNVCLTQNKDAMNHLVQGEDLQDIEVVTSVKLQDEVGGINFAMGKMDIEGAELLAMKGAVKMLESQNPPVWLFEVNDLSRHFGYAREDMIRFLGEFGYCPVVYVADENRLRRDKDGWRVKRNIIMVSESYWGEVEDRIAV